MKLSVSIRDDRIVLILIKEKKGWIDHIVPIISFTLKILLSHHGTDLCSGTHFPNFTIPGWLYHSAVPSSVTMGKETNLE